MGNRVCFLLNNPFVSDNRVEREAQSLTQAGYTVSVFAVRSPGLPHQEQRGGIRLFRVFPKHLPNFSPVALTHLGALWRIATRHRRFDVVHAHDINTLLLGFVLSRLWRCPLVYDSHEWWASFISEEAERLTTQPPSPKVEKKRHRLQAMAQLETHLMGRADAIISVNDAICGFLKQRIPGHSVPCVTLRNIPRYFPLPAERPRHFHQAFPIAPETRVILYQGGITRIRGIPCLLEAVQQLLDLKIALILMGPVEADYADAFHAELEALRQKGFWVFHKPPVTEGEEALLQWTASADLGVHPIRNTRGNNYYCLPNKLFEYIQAEVPVAVSRSPEMQHIVETYDVGVTFDPEDSRDIAGKIRQFFTQPEFAAGCRTNLPRAKAELQWGVEEKRLLALYQGLNQNSSVAESLPGSKTLTAPTMGAKEAAPEKGP